MGACVVGLALALLAFLAARWLPVQPLDAERTVPASVASAILVVAGAGTWGAPLLVWWLFRQDRTVTALRDQAVRFVATAFGATCITVLAALYLSGFRLVDGGGLVVLAAAAVGLYAAPYIWMFMYFVRR